MRILSLEQLEELRPLIGQHTYSGRNVLRDGGKMWVFTSMAELDVCQELSREDISRCRQAFVNGEKFAIVYRLDIVFIRADEEILRRHLEWLEKVGSAHHA